MKYLAYGWSSQRSLPALRDQVVAALAAARLTGWDGLLAAQRAYLDEFWTGADVELDGDPELQQAVRFALFHTLQAGARAEQRAIAAKGLTGPGYDGHTFWDTERFVLPVLTYTAPGAAADALRWRHSTLDLARERARQLNLAGASFPWRTIRGQECSGYWPAGTAAFHVNAAIADAVLRYQAASDDEAFEREVGVELLVETARLWRSLGHHDADGSFRIDGITGPDEYSSLADNNVYTNLLAARNLQGAADAVERHPAAAEALGVEPQELEAWRKAAGSMLIPWDERLGVHPQSESFTEHAVWDFAGTPPEHYPLLLHYTYFDLYRKQVVKQADLVLALHVAGDAFTAEQKARDFDYYEPLTVRDSSLSAATQGVVAAEVGYLDLAYDYFAEAALMDLHDLQHNTRDGIHIASLAGAWSVAVAGFGGMRDFGGRLSFAPRLPRQLQRLAFRVVFRGRKLAVEVTSPQATYQLLEGAPLEIAHHGSHFQVSGSRSAARSRRCPSARRRASLRAARRDAARRSPRTREGAVARALSQSPSVSGLAARRLRVHDVAGRALLVPDPRSNGARQAVRRRGHVVDRHVLDPGVVARLQLREAGAHIARGVVGVVGLEARHRRADVRLRGRVVRPVTETQVRGDRDREQDPEDDDHDQELDQGESLLAPKPLPQCLDHGWKAPLRGGSSHIDRNRRGPRPSKGVSKLAVDDNGQRERARSARAAPTSGALAPQSTTIPKAPGPVGRVVGDDENCCQGAVVDGEPAHLADAGVDDPERAAVGRDAERPRRPRRRGRAACCRRAPGSPAPSIA